MGSIFSRNWRGWQDERSRVPTLDNLRRKGALGLLEAVVRRVESRLGAIRRRIEALRRLRRAEWTAHFIHEGSIEVRLPQLSTRRSLLGLEPRLKLSADFIGCTTSEALLRRTVHTLYATGIIDTDRSIIDIGCWCGDNSLAWARGLTGTARVWAIDPAAGNLAFAQCLAEMNGITNVEWVEAVCSDRAGQMLTFTGPIEHARFHPAPEGSSGLLSSTLDDIIGAQNLSSIGLLHVDVEGFEARVLRGAARIIAASQPIILYEQHLSDDDLDELFDWLSERGYSIFMVNEIIPDCRPDCRNFIAIPSGVDVPSDLVDQHQTTHSAGYVPATIGPDLVPVVR